MLDDRAQIDPRLSRSGELMAAACSLDDVVAVLRRSAKPIIGCDGIAVVLRDGGFCHYVAEDAVEPLWAGQRFPMEMCVSGWAMRNDETLVISDITGDPRVPVAPYRNKSIRSLAIAPIGAPEPVAALGAYWCAWVLLDAGTVDRMKALARQATGAITRIRTLATMDAA